MVYECDINGIRTEAHYSEENIQTVFLPLLKRLQCLKEQKGKRILVLLAAPPASGKSTLLSFLKHLAETEVPDLKLTTIGMDGFHRYQDYLLTHHLMRDGKSIRMVDVKGCPETFDLEKLTAAIHRI
ncbi:MAG: hypothetical protein KBS81_00145, partial [Spirochaetales bacterium]|nr:hypothetical protein [Candidatus Physcosoma equi]